MNTDIFPDIKFRPEFKDFEKEQYYQMIQFLKNGTPDLKNVFVNNEASNILKYKVLLDFTKILKENRFKKFMPVKGMWLINNLFSDFAGIRQMADIDILIHPDEFKKIPLLLRSNDKIQIKSRGSIILRSFFAEEISVVLNSVLIEMHSNITLVSFPGLINEVFENTKEIEYQAILMILHDYSRSDFCDLTSRRLLEFYIVLNNCNIARLIEITDRFGIRKMLDCHLFLIYTMIEDPFFPRDSFSIDHSFGYIERSGKKAGFIVTKRAKLQKTLYGKKRKRLFIRNLFASFFKTAAGIKR